MTSPTPVLRCPSCAEAARGSARIGHQRGRCRECNRWAQAVRRETLKVLVATVPEDEQRLIRTEVERIVYAEHYPDSDVAAALRSMLAPDGDRSTSATDSGGT